MDQSNLTPFQLGAMFVVAVGTTSVAAAGALALVEHTQQALIERVQAAGKIDPSEVLNEHAYIATLDAFAPTTREHDAGELLNPHLKLDMDGYPAESPLWWTDVSDDERERIRDHWLDDPELAFGPDPWSRYDDRILQSLMAYDHWVPESSGAYRTYLSGPVLLPDSAPIPDLIGLQCLVKARLARALHQEQVRPALEEVRHLARLLLNSEQVVSVMVGLSVLSAEREAAEKAMQTGLLAPDDWTPVSSADADRVRNAIFDGPVLLVWPERPEAQVLFDRPHVVGRCAMLELASVSFIYTRAHTERGPAPFEADFQALRTQYDAIRAASGCTLVEATRNLDEKLLARASREAGGGPDQAPYLRSYTSAEIFEMHLGSRKPR